MDNIFVRYIKFPNKVPAATILDDNGDYNVYINSGICPEKQKFALKHELSHIENNHFYDDNSLDDDEYEADSDAELNVKIPKSLLSLVHWEGFT